MAEAIVHGDYGWFTPADLANVVRAIHRVPGRNARVVLDGGQALTAWVQHYGIPLPTIEGEFLTADADFLASKGDAQLIASHLKDGRARFPNVDDHTPNAAVIDFTGEEGSVLHIDILGVVLGLQEEEIRRLAVSIQIEGYEPISVLHPLLVLESRCVNLEKLSEKRHANGITQARVACSVVQKYIDECLAEPVTRRRECLNAARRITALAQSTSGVFVYQHLGIDVLTVIDPAKMPGRFSQSWHYDVERTNRKRDVAAHAQTRAR